MARREFRIICGPSFGSPEHQATSRRTPTRRQFKTIHCGIPVKRGPRLKAVTLKGIDKADGETVWEYGPGSYWRQHYGADAISGVVPDLEATLDKYAIAAGAYPTFSPCGNRNTATLAANVCEGLSVVKLNSLDGTTIESATLTGMFTGAGSAAAIGLIEGLSIRNAAALSGGDYVIVGERVPFIEFEDFASNTATKSYILHAHGQQAGNVYLKTRTSSEIITIPFDSEASAVETLFEATSDCIAATATGGPWPLLPISIEVEWSVSGGDVSEIATTPTYSAQGIGVDWSWNIIFIDDGIQGLEVTVDRLSIGFTLTFEFSIGETFSYTSTTEDVSDFLDALAAAMEAFAIAQGPDGAWESVVSGLPDTISVDGNKITVIYSSAIGIDPLFVTATGGEGPTDARRTGSCAAAYSTSTGDMTSAVGFNFGYSEDRPTLKMFAETEDLPTVTGLNVLGIASIGSGPDNSVVITPDPRNSGDGVKTNVVEKWDIADGAWAFDWQVYCNAVMLMPSIIYCESGYFICPIGAKRFDGVNERTAARLAVADGNRTELNTKFGSINPPDNEQSTKMFDDTPGSYFTWGYEITYEDQVPGSNSYTINDRGADTWIDGDELRLGAIPFGVDAAAVYATRTRHISGRWRYDTLGTNTDSDLYFRFFPPYTARSAEPQQFRFKLSRMPGTNYTAWLDWYATESEMETALNNLLGSGNVVLVDFGYDLTPVVNDPVAPIEFNISFKFETDRGFTPGSGRIPVEYFRFRNDGYLIAGVEIEMQNITPFADPAGIAAFSTSDASFLWSRPFGSKSSVTVEQPTEAWLQGDFVYAYGTVVDNEL